VCVRLIGDVRFRFILPLCGDLDESRDTKTTPDRTPAAPEPNASCAITHPKEEHMRSKRAWMAVLMAIAVIGAINVVSAGSGHDPAKDVAVTAATPATPATVTATATVTAPAADPYLAAETFSSEAPTPVVSCQMYANDCVFDGGPCGPGGVCHCQINHTSTICAR
jgi:hypothetical protein